MLGLANNEPAYLDRYGPIAADLARNLARDLSANGTFRCAATDDQHGTILGLGLDRRTYTSSYQPGTCLRELIQTTWPRCSFPGCTTRAVRSAGTRPAEHTATCDLDHTRPWPDGPTCSCNMAPLCRKHRVMKTKGRITVETSTDPTGPPGTLHWRLPSGRQYTTKPPPLIMERVRRKPTAERPTTSASESPPREPPPGLDSQPPF